MGSCVFMFHSGVAAVTTLAAITDLLRSESRSYRWSQEKDLQDAVEMVLNGAGFDHTRECRLGEGDRIDFLVGDIGIETKIRSGLSEVTRQLFRYVRHDRVSAIVLFTASQRLAIKVPSIMNRKPIVAIGLPGGF
jgi:hypothetical protein